MMPLKKKTVAMMIAAGWLACTSAWATSISVVGLFKDKAIVSIDGGKPRTLSAGQTVQDVKLVSADSDSASYDIEAKRIGIDYRSGQPVGVGTAAGVVPAWRVKFNTVKVGGISVNQVDGMVVETGLNVPLLGMSFLNRMEM